MKRSHPPFANSGATNTPISSVASILLPALLENWLVVCDINQHSARTVETRRERVSRLLWFLQHKGHEVCALTELRLFFHYLTHGHKEPGGRWGNPKMVKPLSSGRIKSYHSTLRTFFNWLVEEGELGASPMERIPTPVDRPDQIQPFTDDQVRALLAATKRSKSNPKRDESILLLLLDTGIRASELCDLDCGDVDLQNGQLNVRSGKGGKGRVIPFSRDTKRALYQYLNEKGTEEGEALFVAEHGITAGERLTRNGLLLIIRRLAKVAKVTGVRCSPHTWRHTFAVSYLRAGGNVFALMQILGHTSLTISQRYVALAAADLKTAHQQFSPVARLKGNGKKPARNS